MAPKFKLHGEYSTFIEAEEVAADLLEEGKDVKVKTIAKGGVAVWVAEIE